ncbi:hypothetical protein PCH70_24500 [Pseudomonas cichorii JBC1]|nr:hypothetical protein PCH70_24500 [Pseudomonas cichorii JBC1]
MSRCVEVTQGTLAGMNALFSATGQTGHEAGRNLPSCNEMFLQAARK